MREWHTLHDEGRWTESVRYLGSGRWTYESVDFLSDTTVRDRLSTKRLIVLIHGWDCDEMEMARVQESKTESDEQTLGPRGLRLLAIAKKVGADRCCRQLTAMRAGQWLPSPKIKAITGIGIRSVWRGVTHKVFIAQTNHGEAYVIPAQARQTRQGRIEISFQHRPRLACYPLSEELARFRRLHGYWRNRESNLSRYVSPHNDCAARRSY